MGAAAAIDTARRHGITLSADGQRIIARPASAITPELREMITARKAELLTHLTRTTGRASDVIPDPAGPCPACGSGQWWQLPGHAWYCRHCTPITGADHQRATTLTLACHDET